MGRQPVIQGNKRVHGNPIVHLQRAFPSPVASFDDGEEPTTMVSLTREIPERQGGSKVA